ncbi:MAG: PilZ domain-containing protein, partial [Methylotenera sp.]|nr:PilZ domain-containing protein [Methylotenera sp.]
AHIGQRIRWARVMAQIFRVDNPLLGWGLSLGQRLCYLNAMVHFFFGLPRLVFLTAPLAFLFFQFHIIHAEAFLLALYVIPYVVQSTIANAHVQGQYRHTFWAEVYETVLAWYVALPTTVALINPKLGKFNVTAKGGLVKKSYFDWIISTPYTILALLNILALIIGIIRLFFWNTFEQGTVLLNLIWVIYSSLLLGASIGVASESKQVRKMHRVATRLPATLYRDSGEAIHCTCIDFSMTGLGLELEMAFQPEKNEKLHVSLWRESIDHAFPAFIVSSQEKTLGVEFETMTKEQSIALVQCTFARPDAWVNWNSENDIDRPMHGLKEIAIVGLTGYKKLFTSIFEPVFEHFKSMRTQKQGRA